MFWASCLGYIEIILTLLEKMIVIYIRFIPIYIREPGLKRFFPSFCLILVQTLDQLQVSLYKLLIQVIGKKQSNNGSQNESLRGFRDASIVQNNSAFTSNCKSTFGQVLDCFGKIGSRIATKTMAKAMINIITWYYCKR